MAPIKHGHCLNGRSSEYKVWRGMRSRCEDPNATGYKYYGARGISVCERWRDFKNFLADMGERPSARHSIERMDNDKGYTPANCRWVSRREQNRNRPNHNRILSIDGISKPLIAWVEDAGISYGAVKQRLNRGWDAKRAVFSPVGKR